MATHRLSRIRMSLWVKAMLLKHVGDQIHIRVHSCCSKYLLLLSCATRTLFAVPRFSNRNCRAKRYAFSFAAPL